MIICRGIIYHKISEDFINLFYSLFKNLKDKKKINKFENDFKRFNQSSYCVSYPYARTALMSILSTEKNINRGDEIIISAIQIKGMIDIITNLGLKPIIVDLSKDNLSFDIQDLKKKISSRTKLILCTYLYGLVPELEDVLKIAKNKNIILVEDFSQCLGGKYKNKIVGNFGDYGIYSLSATKTLDTYGGGLLVTNKKKLYLKNLNFSKKLNKISRFFLFKKILLSFIRNLCSKKPIFFLVISIFKILNFFNLNIYSKFIGSRDTTIIKDIPKNWLTNFTSLQAEYGTQLLKNVNSQNIMRIKNVNLIKKTLDKKFYFKTNNNSFNVYWQLAIKVKNSEFLRKKALKSNIDIASPSIQLLSKVIKSSKIKNAKNIYKNLLLIPSYHTLKTHEITSIGRIIKSLCQK